MNISINKTLSADIMRLTNKSAEQVAKFLPEISIELYGISNKGGKFAEARIPREFANITLETSPASQNQAKVYERLKQYIATFDRMLPSYGGEQVIQSLYLFSTAVGTGKTTTACAVAKEFMLMSWKDSLMRNKSMKSPPAFFLDVNELQMLYNKFNRKGIPEDIGESASREYYSMLNDAKKAPFTVFDDIGVRGMSEAFLGDLHDCINFRVVNNLPRVYTSNINIDDLQNTLGHRLADRIKDQTKVVTFEGTSQRGIRIK